MLAAIAVSSAAPLPPPSVRTLIRTSRAIVQTSGDRVWPGLSRAPLPLQLVEPARELLFCVAPLRGFTPAGSDPVTGCTLQMRPRQLPVDVSAATFLEDLPVIQMGLPAALGATPADWTVTFLHEAFHQYQAVLPGYQAAIDAVGRSLGQTGVGWMLDYPFPYSDPAVGAAFAQMNTAATAFLSAKPGEDTRKYVEAYLQARRGARAAAGEKHWQYYEFQVGQEGAARWIELELADIAGRRNKAIAAVARDRRLGLFTSLRAIDSQGLRVWKRGSFYIFGAFEMAMMSRFVPDWQREYQRAPFAVGAALEAAIMP